jgi:very-short-patch-repair endonuclease
MKSTDRKMKMSTENENHPTENENRLPENQRQHLSDELKFYRQQKIESKIEEGIINRIKSKRAS